jgi:microcystin-dependent protein
MTAFAGGSPPSGRLLADGEAVSRTTYAALFGVIGTAFGADDGSTTFNLPDMRGRAAFGVDDMGGTVAALRGNDRNRCFESGRHRVATWTDPRVFHQATLPVIFPFI